MKIIHIPDDGPASSVVRPGAAPAPTAIGHDHRVSRLQRLRADDLARHADDERGPGYLQRAADHRRRERDLSAQPSGRASSSSTVADRRDQRSVSGYSKRTIRRRLTPSAQGLAAHRSRSSRKASASSRPLFGDRLRLNYLLDFQQFAASSESHASFHRWSLDLKHEFPLYRTVSSTGPKDTNGPNECFQSVGSTTCPPVSYSRNREGSVGFRLLTTRSTASDGNSVPFYFQPTLGGSDSTDSVC